MIIEKDGAVDWVTFNRPEARNAMTFDMYDDLHDLCDQIDKDPEVRVVVVRGAGDKSFAAVVREEKLDSSSELAFGITAVLDGVGPGHYIARGFLTTDPLQYVAEVGFDVIGSSGQ